MAKHEFGIMQQNPQTDEQFVSYEPEKYDCIEVDDELIVSLLVELEKIPCYWHTLQRAGNGLAYCGVTLIPPASLAEFIDVLSAHSASGFAPLLSLAQQAKEQNKYLIHFGI